MLHTVIYYNILFFTINWYNRIPFADDAFMQLASASGFVQSIDAIFVDMPVCSHPHMHMQMSSHLN